ncbi:MAG: retroviral-like aspartic protease family protein [Pseudomonadota bacterium]
MPGLAQNWRRIVATLVAAASVGAAPPRDDKRSLPPAPMPPLTVAEHDSQLAIAGQDLNARKVNTRMTVMVHVNDKGPYRFVVDSGADTTVVGQRIARALALPLGRPAILNGITATNRVDRVLVDSLTIGDTTINNLQLPVLNEADLGGEGMIGIDGLVEQRLMLDFEKRVIKVEDARRPAPRYENGDIVVTAYLRRGQLIMTQARANGRQVSAVIDTGSEITIGNIVLRDQLLRRGAKMTPIEVTGVTGVTIKLQVARVRELRLGPVVLADVPIAFADVPPFTVFALKDQPALLLGTDLMDAFRRVSLDFRARKVRFQLRRCQSSGITINTDRSSALSRISMDDGSSAACLR